MRQFMKKLRTAEDNGRWVTDAYSRHDLFFKVFIKVFYSYEMLDLACLSLIDIVRFL